MSSLKDKRKKPQIYMNTSNKKGSAVDKDSQRQSIQGDKEEEDPNDWRADLNNSGVLSNINEYYQQKLNMSESARRNVQQFASSSARTRNNLNQSQTTHSPNVSKLSDFNRSFYN